MPEALNPGDKVIDLAGAARTASLVSGVASGVISGWIMKHSLITAGGGIVLGAVLGWFLGSRLGKLLFPAPPGRVTIAKWGPSSLPLTLKGNIVSSLVTSVVICAMAALIPNTDIKTIAGISIIASILIGVILAILVSLI
jgi:hypothetical protein